MISIIAHRGYSSRFRENSPQAWREAAKAGADVVEVDIRFTADKVPVCFHDSDLRRLTGRDERVEDISYDRLAFLTADGLPVAPQFTEALAAVPPTVSLLLDVKDERDEALERLEDMLREAGRRDFILGLHKLRSVSRMAVKGHARILGLVQDPNESEAFIAAGARIVRLWESDTTPARLDALASKHVPVWVTTGEGDTGRRVGDFDSAGLQRLARSGASGFLVNDPAGARAALKNELQA